MDYVALGQRIRTRRRALHMTQEELAKQAGVSASFLGHIERGTRAASLETLMQLCAVLDATPNKILGMEHAHMIRQLPECMTVSTSSLLQGISDLLKNLQILERNSSV